MNLDTAQKALCENHFTVRRFLTGAEAADYLNASLDNRTIGFGDSATLSAMNLYQLLAFHNTVFDPARAPDNDRFLETAQKCLTTEVFITSVNALVETGEMVNIDGTGNRVAGSLFGHKKVYFVISANKIEPTLERAVWRARNIVAPQNARRYHLRTPCAIRGDRCYNCSSPDRICNAMVIYYKKMNDIDDVEVVLIEEALGY